MFCVVAMAVVTASAGAALGQSISAQCLIGTQTASCDQWFTTPMTVAWQTDTPPDSVSPCQLGIAYRFDADTNEPLSCTATWGTTQATYSFKLRVELSSPTATATPDRPPDANGWYNHPVTVSLSGTAFSQIASCTAPQTYAGPATRGTVLAGTCTDNAGKVASASFPLRYDATPPTLTVNGRPADRLAGLSWHATSGPAPLAAIRITRRPGLTRSASSLLYSGANTTFQDHEVRNGTSYTYTVTAVDQAGNVAQRTVRITPGIRLLSPRPNARLSAPPTLRWTEIPQASYYNVQLFRGSKILSAWPTHASLRLSRTWRYAGRRHRLAPGRYRWYVWPGYGPKSDAHYGKAIGDATFAIR